MTSDCRKRIIRLGMSLGLFEITLCSTVLLAFYVDLHDMPGVWMILGFLVAATLFFATYSMASCTQYVLALGWRHSGNNKAAHILLGCLWISMAMNIASVSELPFRIMFDSSVHEWQAIVVFLDELF